MTTIQLDDHTAEALTAIASSKGLISSLADDNVFQKAQAILCGREAFQLPPELALTTTYDRCGYDYAIDYTQAIEPSLDDASVEWVRSILPR